MTGDSFLNPLSYRIRAERAFFGDAAAHFDGQTLGLPDGGDSWLGSAASGYGYLGVNSQVVITTANASGGGGRYALATAARTSSVPGSGRQAIAHGMFAWNDGANGMAWGCIAELLQTSNGYAVYGREINANNQGANYTINPYNRNSGGGQGIFGDWMGSGGDSAFFGGALNPANAGIVFFTHVTAPGKSWNKGVVFCADALTGTDGSATSTGTGVAIEMARRHAIEWCAPTGGTGARIASSVTDGANRVVLTFFDNQANIMGANGAANANIFVASHVAGATNYIEARNSVAGSPVAISAKGADTDVDLKLSPQGAGVIRYGQVQPITTETGIVGWISWKDKNGVACKLAVIGP